jgi:hypothetical protein
VAGIGLVMALVLLAALWAMLTQIGGVLEQLGV